jgi:type VI secretion system protein VasJ
MTFSSSLATHYLALAEHPIEAGNFGGEDARYSSEYEQLEAELAKASSLHQSGQIDWQLICGGSEVLLRTLSKDLRVAAWLAWALYQRERFTGLQAGIALLHALCTQHWDDLHPRKVRTRSAALGWLLTRLEPALSQCSPTPDQLPLFQQLVDHLKELDTCLSTHLGEEAPLLLPLCRRIDEHVKRAGQAAAPVSTITSTDTVTASLSSSSPSSNTPAGPIESDKDAHKALRAQQDSARTLCTWWTRQKATDIRPLRLNRALLWLGIDSVPEHNAEQITALRGLPADKIASYKERFEQGQHASLLVDVEASLARAPFWFDGQRLAWECLQAQGAEAALKEIEMPFALFLSRVSGIVELRFHDGQPFADAETRAWISAHVMPHLQAPSAPREAAPSTGNNRPAWEEALEALLPTLRKDGLKHAVQTLKQGMTTAQGGRERFFWQLTMARLCFQAKKYDLAKTQLQTLDETLQRSGLAEWEPELALDVLQLLYQCCELLPQNPGVRDYKDELYRRLCHIDLEVVLD